jgi:aryl-alcohol dehydrogenase-like predicted oxidoreductase
MTTYRRLGSAGIRVASMSLGTANFGASTPEETAQEIIAASVDAGINLIDTADSYAGGESERIVGRALKALGLRQQVLLLTKFHFPTGPGLNQRGNSRLHMMQAVEESLSRLQTDYLDIYMIHRPDFEVPQEETMRALDDLVRQGKIRYVGTSTYPAWMIMEAITICREWGFTPPVVEELPYSLVERRAENEVIPLCRRHGVGVLAWSPLAGGTLAGAYPIGEALDVRLRQEGRDVAYFRERVTHAARRMAEEVDALAREADFTSGQLALIWAKEQPGISSILIGPRRMAHLKEALSVMQQELDPDLASALDEISLPGTAVADFYNNSGWMAPILSE